MTTRPRTPSSPSDPRRVIALLAALALPLAAAPLPATAPPADCGTGVGINRNFVDPEVALDRQTRHNNSFVTPVGSSEHGQILDLQTSAYALAERPPGLDYDVYSAIGYGLATSMMVVGPRTDEHGHRRVVIIDTLEDFKGGQTVADAYIAKYNATYGTALDRLPIDAIIYTHNHIDHTGGVLGYLDRADKLPCPIQDPDLRGLGGDYLGRRSCIEIVSQEKVVDAVENTSTVSGQMIQARSLYMYGIALRNELEPQPTALPLGRAITNGIGPFLTRGLAGFRLPSRTFANDMNFEAAGVQMHLTYVPSETNDELAVFVPDALNGAEAGSEDGGQAGLLFSAEVIQGPAFPNLYSLRGTEYRSAETWYQSVDKLRQYDAWCMVPSHGPPVCQRRNISLLLTNFRDAVQFTHDQTVRFMNMGYKPDELARLVEVPEVVVSELGASLVPWPNANPGFRGPVCPQDYLLPFYGSVPQGVRETYFGYLGWYDGDPVNLQPTPPDVAATRMAALVGSGTDLLTAAEQALAAGDAQWAAELATIGVRAHADPADAAHVRARQIKSKAYLELGNRALDPNWSDWFFTSANELAEIGDRPNGSPCFLPFQRAGLISPIIQAAMPIDAWISSWTWKLDGRKAAAAGADQAFGFWVQPTVEQDFGPDGYVLQLRHGIVEVSEWKGTKDGFVAAIDVGVQVDEAGFDALILPADFQSALTTELENGRAKLLAGDPAAIAAFFQYFDGTPDCEPPISVPRFPD